MSRVSNLCFFQKNKKKFGSRIWIQKEHDFKEVDEPDFGENNGK
jgi:hypothetical protein